MTGLSGGGWGVWGLRMGKLISIDPQVGSVGSVQANVIDRVRLDKYQTET